MDPDAWSVLILGLAPLLLPVPLLLHGARPDRRLMAVSPGVVGAAVYVATFLASYGVRSPVPDSILGLHMVASAMPLVLLAPAVMALRRRWLSVVHLITLAGTVWAWVVGGVLIAGTS